MEKSPVSLSKAEKAQATRRRNQEVKSEAARAEREAARQAVIDRYGSEEAARAPTEREKAILDAGEEYDRRRAAGEVAEGEYREAYKAWPMPGTYAAALAEQAEWDARDAEFFALDMQIYQRRPNSSQSLPRDLEYRSDEITDLVEWKMPLRTVAEIHDRLKRFTAIKETHTDYAYALEFVVAAVERDLGAMVDAENRKARNAAGYAAAGRRAIAFAEAEMKRQAK